MKPIVILLMVVSAGLHAGYSTSPSSIYVNRDKNLTIDELPLKVQDAVRDNCQGKVMHINEVNMNSRPYYRVVCKLDGVQLTYHFDSEGNVLQYPLP